LVLIGYKNVTGDIQKYVKIIMKNGFCNVKFCFGIALSKTGRPSSTHVTMKTIRKRRESKPTPPEREFSKRTNIMNSPDNSQHQHLSFIQDNQPPLPQSTSPSQTVGLFTFKRHR
jgi:hypothetical protein